ncbi:MAG: tripartite tricarboxylate transporter substrate binding protein [Ramlibacter sp.]
MFSVTKLLRSGSVFLFAIAAACAHAQADYPTKPIKVIVPFAAGQSGDVILRNLADPLGKEAGVPVVIDNKPGAAGFIAVQAVVGAAPDGYTVLVGSNTTHAANAVMFKKLPYDPIGDFAPVTLLNKGALMFVVTASSPIASAQDLLARARQSPGTLTYGAASSSTRMSAEMFQQMGNAKVRFVPYKGAPQAVTDLLGGTIDFVVADLPTVQPLIQQGKLRGIAVTSARRHSVLNTVPTWAESGLPGFELDAWSAVFVPAATPKPVIAKLNAFFRKALGSPSAKNFYQLAGLTPEPTTPEALAAFVKSESDKWARLVRAAGIEPE